MATAGVVLAGGRSQRMGQAKADLDWHGSTLLRRVSGVLARAVDGPVLVVRAPGQRLPRLAPEVRVCDDPVAGQGPLAGIATGLAAAGGVDAAFVCATDLPFLHPAFVRRVVAGLAGPYAAAVPLLGGYRQPLAAAYRTTLAGVAYRLLDGGARRATALLDACLVATLDEATLRGDPELAAADPGLESVTNLNDAGAYTAALARPAPLVTANGVPTRAATVAALGAPGPVSINGGHRTDDGDTPLVTGDEVSW